MSLGSKIRQLRSEREWTQGQLAVKASVPRSYINSIEHDRISNPGADRIVLLAKALGVEENELLEAAGIKNVNETIETNTELAELISLIRILPRESYKEAKNYLLFLSNRANN